MNKVYIALVVSILFVFLRQVPSVHAAASEEAIASEQVIENTDTTMKDKGEESYDAIKERAEQQFLNGVDQLLDGSQTDSDADPIKDFWVGFFYIYDVIKNIAAAIIVGSFILGMLIAKLSKQNKGMKRAGLFGFCFFVPFIVLVFIYVTPYLYDELAKV